jgi:hypothetical protein
VGILAATGVFLFCYRGPDKQDNILTNVAGLCAVSIAWLVKGQAILKDKDVIKEA